MNNNKDIPQFVDSDSFMSDKDYLKWLFDFTTVHEKSLTNAVSPLTY